MPDRDILFTDLPKQGEALAQFYDTYDALLLPFYLKRDETRRFDFSAANLYRKYGAAWFEKFADSCHRRLRSWGCNTIANSSDLRICLQDRTPYAERVEVASRPIAGSWGTWANSEGTVPLLTIRKLVKMRHEDPIWSEGSMEWVTDGEANGIVAFTRTLGTRKVLVAANLTNRTADGGAQIGSLAPFAYLIREN